MVFSNFEPPSYKNLIMANLVLLPKKKSPSHKGDDPKKVLNLSCIFDAAKAFFSMLHVEKKSEGHRQIRRSLGQGVFAHRERTGRFSQSPVPGFFEFNCEGV